MRTDKIGINISRLRIERGITQEQLGRDIGLTASAISNIECELILVSKQGEI